jgi:hypothetical protein
VESKYYNGKRYECPVAVQRNVYSESVRLRLLSDGIAECIAFSDPNNRRLVSELQMAWMMVQERRDEIASPPPQGVFPCVQ